MCGEKYIVSIGLTYELNEEGTGYIVAGIGTCTDTELVIPTTYAGLPVVEIGDWAFHYCENLTSITIPDSVTSIGDYAFYLCYGLQRITIGTGVTHIGIYAFWMCFDLTSITIPDNVTNIGKAAFESCGSLISVSLGNGITVVSPDMFSHCTSLTSITIPNGVTRIGERAFLDSGLNSIIIPNSINSIGAGAFIWCDWLNEVYYAGRANDWTSISIEERNGSNSYLTNATIHYNWKYIPVNRITLSETVVALEVGVHHVITATINPDNASITAVRWISSDESVVNLGVSVEDSTVAVLRAESVGTVTITAITVDGTYVATCVVTVIDSTPDSDEPMSNASVGLEYELNIDETGYIVAGIGTCTDTELVIPTTYAGLPVVEIGDWAFEGCTELTKITIGTGVTSIGYFAFDGCTGLNNITIPNSVVSIGGAAFHGCSGLTSITIPDSVTSIDLIAFSYCTSLTSITIPDSVMSIGDGVFYGCAGLTSMVVASGNTVYHSIDDCLIETATGTLIAGCQNSKIPATVTNIGYAAFAGCIELKSITIPESITSIDEGAFEGCTDLTNVYYTGTEEEWAAITIGEYNECLTNATIHYNWTGSDVQPDDANVSLEYKLNDAGTGYIVTGIGNCTDTEIVIPAAYEGLPVVEIGDWAFEGCTSLTSITIPGNIQTLGHNVFYGCSNLERLYYTGTADEWALVTINNDNVYPLRVTPYYYSSDQPTIAGNYWYYNTNNAKRVWDVSADAYRAEEYSENFVEIFGEENSSYATTFYNDLQSDTKLMLGIQAWELIHITAEPSYIFDPNDSLISKKDLYKLTLYDIITGEKAEEVSFKFFEQSSTNFILYVGNMYLGDPTEAPIDIDMLYSVLHNKDASAIQSVLEKAVSPTEIECVMAIVGFAENAYQALESVSQYVALRQVKSGYVDVLLAIYNDTSNPKDLRDAALELANWYQEACDLTLAEFQMKTFVNATNEDVYSWTLDKIVDVAIDSDASGILKAVNFTGKAIRAIAEPLELDEFCQAYYQLKTSVGVESALRKLIQVTLPDYMRYENQGASENYMCTIELYEKSVLYGFDYSINLLTAYVNSSDPDEEGMEKYANLAITLTSYKEEKQVRYNRFDNAVFQRYEAYYS